uniref:Uncharacterized protein n=1 Tax=Hemiselmis tepida TaxID=464990 RepID=A0A7S0W4U8_9CRYP|mmetsp:Transcript_3660/g.9452  ORF Transcript_3660/g.9452 Transcript_3660/m.9452 type:complete len:218 (+) Transcript_3660:117-770(+)
MEGDAKRKSARGAAGPETKKARTKETGGIYDALQKGGMVRREVELSPSVGPSCSYADPGKLASPLGSRSSAEFAEAACADALAVLKEEASVKEMHRLREESRGNISTFFSTYIPGAQKLLEPVAARHGHGTSENAVVGFFAHLKAQSSKPEATQSFKDNYQALIGHFRAFAPASVPKAPDAESTPPAASEGAPAGAAEDVAKLPPHAGGDKGEAKTK